MIRLEQTNQKESRQIDKKNIYLGLSCVKTGVKKLNNFLN